MKLISYAQAFSNAVCFLTIFPTRWYQDVFGQDDGMKAAVRFFPWVGLILASILNCIAQLVQPVLREALMGYMSFEVVEQMVAVLISLCLGALLALLTRGLHLDGCADVFDAYWGGSNPEACLHIMKDSRVGSYALVGMFFALNSMVLLIACLIIQDRLIPILFLACTFSRCFVSCISYTSSSSSTDGIGKSCMHKPSLSELVITVVPLLISVALYAYLYLDVLPDALLSLLISLVLTSLLAYFVLARLKRKFLGINGDVMGFMLCFCEFCILGFGVVL